MKKIIVTGFVAMLALSSCKKDRTCTCSFFSVDEKVTLTEVTKAQAKANCHSYQIKEDQFTFDVTCKLD